MINLLLAPRGESLNIVKINYKKIGNEKEIRHLTNLGFVTGAKIDVLTEASGNLIVKIKDSKMDINEKIARNIFV